MTNAERLDRIEEKIDKLSDAIVSIARADLEDRLRKVEDITALASSELRVINKIFWIAMTALVTGGIAMILWGGNLSMF